MTGKAAFCVLALSAVLSFQARAQSVTDLAALKGLVTVTTLSSTSAGNAALAANYAITGGIQTGEIRQATLLPFAEQQQQALRDAFIADKNLSNLVDGLGSTLAAAYLARAHYSDRQHFTSVSQTVENLIAYANATTFSNSSAAKYFFANETIDGKTSASDEAKAILKDNGGSTDTFGRAYGLPAGTVGGNRFGNARPFQTEPSVTRIFGRDYFGAWADNTSYNSGPAMNLTNSPSYPSGHTTYGYMGSVLLAILVPERYSQMIVRGAEYGNDRIIIGAHYAMDIMGGRTLALYDMAHLLANDPAYRGQSLENASEIKDFRAQVVKARADIVKTLEAACGNTIAVCAKQDTGRFSDAATNEAFYASTQTYGLPLVYPKNADGSEDVAKLAPEAGYLLTVAFPSLTLDVADKILTETEGPGGGFLDDGSAFGIYSRLNLYAASERAAQITVK
jgi:PAP2 superfamily